MHTRTRCLNLVAETRVDIFSFRRQISIYFIDHPTSRIVDKLFIILVLAQYVMLKYTRMSSIYNSCVFKGKIFYVQYYCSKLLSDYACMLWWKVTFYDNGMIGIKPTFDNIPTLWYTIVIVRNVSNAFVFQYNLLNVIACHQYKVVYKCLRQFLRVRRITLFPKPFSQ